MSPLRRPLGLLAVALVLGATLAACSPNALEFTIGECLNLPDGTSITDYEPVDCDEPHDAEVYALPQHPSPEAAEFPGAPALEEFADERCKQDFEGYVGIPYDDSTIYSTALTPSAELWDQSDNREIVCLLVGEPIPDAAGGVGFAQLTGSKRDSAE